MGGEALSCVKAQCPRVGECQSREAEEEKEETTKEKKTHSYCLTKLLRF